LFFSYRPTLLLIITLFCEKGCSFLRFAANFCHGGKETGNIKILNPRHFRQFGQEQAQTSLSAQAQAAEQG
jgi:hypothetical protein